MIKRHQRGLSFVLSFSLFLTAFTGFSVQSAQASPQPTSARSAPPTSDELGLTGDPIDENDLKENYSLRSVNSKTYRNKDGMNLVAVYDNAVHYLKDDAWKNIDNTLSEAPSVDGVAVLANKANNFSVKFAKTTKANFIGMLQKGNYSIKWSLKGAKESPVTKSVSDEVQPERAWDLTKVRSSVRYAQILPSTDLEYVVKGSEIKENLILNQPGLSESYTFLYQLSNLSARQDGNIIRFFDSRDSEKEVFALEAPFVFDAKDESTDAQFTLTDLGNGKVEVKVSVDPAWLSAPERVYPVVIDPPLRTSPVTSDILDAHVSRLAPDKNFSTTSYLSIGSSDTPGSLCRVYVKFNLPTMDPSDVVVDAKLNLFSRSYEGTGESEVQLHEVTSPWDDTSITWNNIPSHSSIISEYDRFSKSKEKLTFDVTGIVREWYNYGQNNGVMIKNADETGKFGTFYSGATSEPDTNLTRPYLTMAYVNNDGLEPYWDYQAASAGRAGTAHVNYFTGAMTYIHPDVETTGNRLPASISHVFGNTKATDAKYGLGWRLNYSQTIKEMNFGGTTYYRYYDEDGTAHYFLYNATLGKWVEENDDEWELKIDPSSTSARYILEDKSGNTLSFRYDTVHGILRKIRDTKNNEIVIETGLNAEIKTITDGAGRITTLNYTNGRLASITDPALRTTSYAYTNDRLTKITYPDGKSSLYTYDPDSGYLTSVRSIDNYGLDFSYTTAWPFKTSKITERGNDSSFGKYILLEYGLNYTKITNSANRSNIYQFSHSGKTISVRDTEGSAVFQEYNTKNDEPRNSNKLILSSKLQRTVLNLIKNPGIERNTDWYTTAAGTSVGTVTSDTSTRFMGTTSKQITKSNSENVHQMTQSLTLDKGKTYTLSAWMKRKDVGSPSATAGAYLRFQYTKSDGNSGFLYSPYVTGTNEDWERMELTFTLPSDAASSTVYIGAGIRNTTGTIWVDNVQLEEGNLANRYNLIENGDFTYKGLGWTSWYDASTDAAVIPTTDPAHPTSLSTNVYPIKGDSTLNKAISQNVKVSGGKGDAFVFSGWGRADSLPIEDYRHFSLSVGINNTDNSTTWKTIHFNEETPDWQYVAQEIVAEKDYASVDIFLLYYKNLNTAYFDGIQLYKEEFGGRYTYNNVGNLEQLNDTNYYYDENQNLVQVEENGDYSQITYDSSGQPINIESNLSKSSAIEYDQYGNIKTTKYGNNLFINSENTYTEDGNYATSSGELGSLSKTVYDYDRTTGNLTKMQTNGKNVRSFEYDKVDNVTKIADATGVGSETTDVLFDYSNDEVSKITRNSFSYNFNYDAYSRLKEFLVKDSLIYSNSYENLNGQLEKTRFSTGYEVKNSFDSLGRLTSISSWNVNNNIQKTLTEFKYNSNILLHEKLDRVLNVSYRYKYDLEGNLYEVNGSDGSKRELYQNVEVGTQLTDSYGLNTFKRNYIENQAQNQSIVIFDNPNAQFETEFDSLGRTSKNNIKTGSNTFSSSYTYFDEAITGSTKLKNIINPLASINLTYDEANKILKQVESGHETLYEYDSLGELVKEVNTSENKTTLYKYDQGGNITKKEVYNIEDVQFQNPISINHYRYDNEIWRDQLTSFNNSPLQYDSVGNTTNFDGWLYQWEDGNRLVSASKGTDAISYTYDEYGIRTSKKINGKKTRFTVYDQKVAFENDGTNLIYYTYDDTGDIIAFNYNGANYYYVKNHLKDIVGILDGSGTVVVKYKYDTFGKVTNISGDLKDSIGVVNPYRYRSYRYDSETGLYYLNSRYYSPVLGRFISPDLIEFLGENGGSISYNLYVYGNNDWINYLDPSGNFVIKTLTLLIRGTIHNIVGALVAAQLILNGRDADTDVTVKLADGGRGYLDVLDVTNRQFYEVKPFNTAQRRWKLIDDQVKKYDTAKWDNKSISRGSKRFKGIFFWRGRVVSYENDSKAAFACVILYKIKDDPVTEKILAKNGAKVKSTRQLESNRTKIIIGVGIGGFAFGAGAFGMGGNRLPNLQFAQ